MSLSDTLFKGAVSLLAATTLVSGIWFSAIAVDTVRQDAQRKKSEFSGPGEELTLEKK